MRLIDLTFSIEEKMLTTKTPWHPKVRIKQLGRIEKEGRNTHKFVLGTHTGTHIDAPRHFIKNGLSIDRLNPELFIQNSALLQFDHKKKGSVIDYNDLVRYEELLGRVKAAVIRTGWSKKWMTENYYKQWPYLTMRAACYLIDKGIKVLGLDTPSPDEQAALSAGEDSPIHCIFMKKGVALIEYLANLELIKQEIFKLYAFPLKLKGLDASPARVIGEVLL